MSEQPGPAATNLPPGLIQVRRLDRGEDPWGRPWEAAPLDGSQAPERGYTRAAAWKKVDRKVKAAAFAALEAAVANLDDWVKRNLSDGPT
jgi:hypothetical protein